MKAEEMWERFKEERNIEAEEYEAWSFGGAPDTLAQLVVEEIKTGTASAFPLYELEGLELPKEGSYSVILNTKEEAVCIIQTKKVYVVPFCEVSESHAYKEGEGDRSLRYWRKVHEEFFTEELRGTSLSFSEDMLVVCEEFVRVY